MTGNGLKKPLAARTGARTKSGGRNMVHCPEKAPGHKNADPARETIKNDTPVFAGPAGNVCVASAAMRRFKKGGCALPETDACAAWSEHVPKAVAQNIRLLAGKAAVCASIKTDWEAVA
jgi:hypothetical protein